MIMNKENIEIVKHGLDCLIRRQKDSSTETICDTCPYRLVKDYCTVVIAQDALTLIRTGKW